MKTKRETPKKIAMQLKIIEINLWILIKTIVSLTLLSLVRIQFYLHILRRITQHRKEEQNNHAAIFKNERHPISLSNVEQLNKQTLHMVFKKW